MYLGKPKTSSNIAWHRHQSNTSRVEEELMQKSVRALANTTDPLEKLRLMCLSRGAGGIMVLCRSLRRMDNAGSKRLNKEQFFHGIKETGLELSNEDTEDLFNRFCKDENDLINLDEFIARIRPPMADSRRHIVEQAFKKLDKIGDGAVTVEELRAVFDVTSNPRFMSGEETADLIMQKFLEHFEAEGIVDGTVTIEEFMNYYSGISVSIEDDCYFDLMMRQIFKL